MATEITTQRSLMGLDTNIAASNKWYAHFAIENVLGPKYSNIELHLKRFSIPQLQMGSTTVSFRGYQKEISTKVLNADTKELTLEYFVDENWRNYKMLFQWMSSVEGCLNPIADTTDTKAIAPSDYIPLHIYLLDNYKKKVISFTFTNTWIKLFNDISLEAGTSEQVTHSFTIVYDDYKIEDL